MVTSTSKYIIICRTEGFYKSRNLFVIEIKKKQCVRWLYFHQGRNVLIRDNHQLPLFTSKKVNTAVTPTHWQAL